MHEFVLSQDVQEEARGVLIPKFGRLRAGADEALSLIRAEIVLRADYEDTLDKVPLLRDPKDAHVIAAAIAADCDLLVTGDKDILSLGGVGNLQIVTPAAALKILGI